MLFPLFLTPWNVPRYEINSDHVSSNVFLFSLFSDLTRFRLINVWHQFHAIRPWYQHHLNSRLAWKKFYLESLRLQGWGDEHCRDHPHRFPLEKWRLANFLANPPTWLWSWPLQIVDANGVGWFSTAVSEYTLWKLYSACPYGLSCHCSGWVSQWSQVLLWLCRFLALYTNNLRL